MASKRTRVRLVSGAAMAALLAFGTAGVARAQTATAAQDAPNPVPPGDPATAATNDIVVTGSRVANGNNQPTPVTVISTQQLLATSPSSVTSALQTLPAFAGMRTPTTNPGNSRQNNAARVLDLRNFGRLRTLALFDGHRLAPSTAEAETDTAFIPSLLISRVDVVTGGASAVYGSDAVTGVVNFITNRSFNGIKGEAHYGLSSRGDGQEVKLAIAGGTELFGGRGHIEASYEFLNNPGIYTKLSRDFGRQVYTVQGGGTAANPYRLITNTRLSSTTFGGYISGVNATTNVGNPLRDMQFLANGVLSPFSHGTAVAAGIESGGDGAFYDKTLLEAESRSHVGFARFDFDLTDDIHFYNTASIWRTHNYNTNINNEFRNITLSATDAFLAPQYQAQLKNANITSFTFSRMFDDQPPTDSETFNKGYMGSVGVEGKIGDKFNWELFYAPSRNSQRTRATANINNGKAFAALDAVVNPANGQIVCNVTLTNPGLYPGCVPLNLFGPTAESAEAMRYIFDTTQFIARTKLDDFGASISGTPFSTWAGPVKVALSGEYRHLNYRVSSNAQPVPLNCTGLRFNCRSSTLIYAGNVLATFNPVSQNVTEGAFEVDVPLLADTRFFRSLNFNGAVRQTHYDTSGSVTTWKAGLDWHVDDQLILRATRSRDIRAPNLVELYSPPVIQVGASNRDLLTGATTSAPLVTTSNSGLRPEVAKVWTAGIVLRPDFLPRFSVAVDFYSIVLDNAITTIQGQDTNTQTVCNSSGGTSPFCALIVRDNTNAITAFLSQPLNTLKQRTKGVDVELNYSAPVGGGNLALRGLVSYQPHEYLTLPGGLEYDAAGAGYGPCCQLDGLSRWRVTAFLNYTLGDLTFDFQERYLSGVRYDANTALVFENPTLPGVAYTNVTLGYRIGPVNPFFSVQNLFDKQPTPFSRISQGATPGLQSGFVPGQDVIGRYFTAGVRFNF